MARTISRKQRLVASTSAFAVLAGITLAAYSDWAEMETEFTTGTFGIAIDGDEGNPVPYSVAFDTSDLNPGESAETLVELQNTGTIDADVALVATTADTGSGEDEAFLDALLGSYSTDGGASWSPEVPLTELTTDADIFLQGGESAPFAVRVHFEEGAGNAAQGGRVGVNFRFEAEQSMGGDDDWPGDVDSRVDEQPSRTYLIGSQFGFDPILLATDMQYDVHEPGPYRVVMDGSEQNIPGLGENEGTAEAPVYSVNPVEGDEGTYVVTYVLQRVDAEGSVVNSWDVTFIASVEVDPLQD